MKFVYLNLKFQKALKNRDDNDHNLHFDNTFLVVLCNLETNLEEKNPNKPGGLVRVTLTYQSHWCQQPEL